LLTNLMASAQQWTKLAEIAFPDLQAWSIDRRGQLFLADSKGNIYQYGSDFKEILNYSPPRPGKIGLLEAWNTQRILAFYPDYQFVFLLDRFLVPNPPDPIKLSEAGFIRLITFAGDQNFWLIDDTDLNLKKWDRQLEQFVVSNPLNLMIKGDIKNLSYMREYQNRVFISDPDAGIHIFDNLGNYISTYNDLKVKWFSFSGDNLLSIRDQNLIIKNIYSLSTQEIPLPGKYKSIILSEKNYFLISEKGVDVFSLN
jgi:hypothetical protein